VSARAERGNVRHRVVSTAIDRLDRIAGQAPANETDGLLAMAKESLELGDLGGAAQAFAQVLQGDPANARALGGLARVYLQGGEPERAREIADMAPEGAKDPDLDSVRAALALADAAPEETSDLEKRLAADPNDHEARYEIATALAGRGAWEAASDHLLKIIEADRAWNDEAARKQLITIFEAAGPGTSWGPNVSKWIIWLCCLGGLTRPTSIICSRSRACIAAAAAESWPLPPSIKISSGSGFCSLSERR